MTRHARSFAASILLIAFATYAQNAFAQDMSELGPAPRTDNDRFDNWVGKLPHGKTSTRLKFIWEHALGRYAKRTGAPERIANDGKFLRENAKQGTPTVTWVGHATVLVQMDHVTFLTDPTWSDTASPVSFAGPKRFVAPGIAIEDLPAIDFVVVSHNHYDHLDLPTLVTLAERSPGTRFFVPLGNERLLKKNGIDNVTALDWGQFAEVGDVRVYCLPAQHWSKRSLTDDLKSLWSSWAVVGPERRFYFAGDTGYFEGFAKIAKALGPFDLAAIPVGAYEPADMMKHSHMNPEQAVQAAVDLNTNVTLAVHYGTFDLANEPLDDPPKRFLKAADTQLPEGSAWVFRIGETRPF